MKRLLPFLFLMTFGLPQLNASHMMGGDIAYECISPGKYKFVIKIYRDCRGIPFNNPDIQLFCKDGSNAVTVNYTRTAINDLTEVCPTDPKPCNPQNTTVGARGIEEHVFEAIVDFNSSPYKAIKDAGCCEVMIKVEQNARNTALNTLVAGTFYTDAMLNLCLLKDKCNTSPQLSTPPVAIICCNKPFVFNNGVREVIDGDSLSYSLVNPLKANNTNESYIGNFTPNLPMTPYCPPNVGQLNCRPIPGANPPRGFYFDKETGDIIFTPTKCDQVGVIVIRIDEWRKNPDTKKWELIGYTKRDMQLIVDICGDNNPPYFTGSNKFSVCEGNKICFNIVTKDDPFLPNQKVPDTLVLTWNYGIPQGSFTIVDPTAREKTAQFCWDTKIGDARPNAYTFTATVKDNNCVNPALANKGFNITVKPKARSIRTYTLGNCGWLKFKALPVDTVNQEKDKYRYQFTIRDSSNSGVPFYFTYSQIDSFKFKRGGKYIIEHFVTNSRYNCPSIYTDTVIIPPVLDVELAFGKDTFVCAGSSLTLEPNVQYGVPAYKYRWEVPVNTFNPKDTLSKYTLVKPTQSTYVMLQLTDKNKCVERDTIFVLYQPNPKVNIGPDQRICTYNRVTLDAQNNDTLRYYWLPNGDSTRTITVNIAGRYVAKVIDKLGCSSSDTMELFVNDTVTANATPDREICIYDTLKVTGLRSPKGYAKQVIWKDMITGGTVSADSSFKVKIISGQSRDYQMYLKITQGGVSCEDLDTFHLDVNLLPTFKFGLINPRCYADGPLRLSKNSLVTAYSGDKTQSSDEVTFSQKKKPSWVTGTDVKYWEPMKFIMNKDIPSNGLTDTVFVSYVDYKQCKAETFKVLKLYPNPVVELKSGTFCQKAGPVNLDRLVLKPFLKTGGIQSFRCIEAPAGLSVDVNSLVSIDYTVVPNKYILEIGQEGENERTGDYKIEYCFKNSISGCQTCDTTTVTVVRLPEIQFSSLPKQCINNPLLALDSFVRDRNTGRRFPDGYWATVEYGGSRDMNNSNTANKINNSVKNQKYFDPSYGPGQFLLKLTDTSSGCPVMDSTEILVNGLPLIQIDVPDTVCSSSAPFDLKNTNPAGTVGKWTGPGVTGRQFDPAMSPKTKQYEGKYMMKFEYTNPLTGCTASDSQSLLVQSQPEVSLVTPTPYQQCEGIPFDIEATKKWAAATRWTKNGDGTFVDDDQLKTVYKHGLGVDTAVAGLNGHVALTISTVKEGVCPIASTELDLIIEPYPQFDFTGDPLIQCEPAYINFQSLVTKPFASTNLRYTWWFGNGDTLLKSTTFNPQNISYDTAKRDWYDVTLIVDNQWGASPTQVCSVRKVSTDMVKVLPQPKAAFSSNPGFFTTVAFPKFNFSNETKVRWQQYPGKMSYLWQFGTSNPDDTSTQYSPNHTYPADTNLYSVHLTSTFTYYDTLTQTEHTCWDTASQLRKIGPDVTVFVPTAFSPEKTGPMTNNSFRAVVNGEKTFHIELYNRWGEKLWESDDKYEAWYGTYRGENAQQDVYAWFIKVTAYDGEEYKYEGTVTLLR